MSNEPDRRVTYHNVYRWMPGQTFLGRPHLTRKEMEMRANPIRKPIYRLKVTWKHAR